MQTAIRSIDVKRPVHRGVYLGAAPIHEEIRESTKRTKVRFGDIDRESLWPMCTGIGNVYSRNAEQRVPARTIYAYRVQLVNGEEAKRAAKARKGVRCVRSKRAAASLPRA